MRFRWRVGSGVALIALTCALVVTSSRAQQNSSTAVADAIQDLEHYRTTIERQRQSMDERYDYGKAISTLAEAFKARGVSEGIAESWAKTWSGAGLTFDYLGARKSVYGYHEQALTDSIDYLKAVDAARQDELEAIAAGMEQWTRYEQTLQSLLAERVELFTKSALNIDNGERVHAMACAGNEVCQKAKTAATDALNAEYKKLSEPFGPNREAIAALTTKFFAAIKGEAAPECGSMTLTYQPSAIRYESEGQAILVYSPPNCRRPQEISEFTIASGDASPFLLDFTTGNVRTFRNLAAEATVKAVHGPLTASANVTSIKRPECEEVQLAYEPRTIRLDGRAKPIIKFLPEDCAKPRSIPHFSSANPRIAWLESGDEGVVRGTSEGLATINLRIENLATQANIAVLNTGPECSQISMNYPVQPLPIGERTPIYEPENISPTLHYSPDQCRRPTGRPNFSMITRSLAKVDAKSGQVIASSYTKNIGTARVGVRHGDLTAVASIEIVSIPVCDWLLLDYAPRELQVHYFSRPKLDYSYKGPYSHPCYRPQGSPEFTLELNTTANDHPVVEIAADGSLRGATPGHGAIKVTHAGLEAHAGIKVLEAEKGPECNAFAAEFKPGPSMRLGYTLVLSERYYLEEAPAAPCQKPNSPLIVESITGPGKIEFTSAGTAIGKSPGEVTVNLKRGNLSASAAVFFVPDEYYECTSMSLTYSPNKLGWSAKDGRRERAVPSVEYSPAGCAVSGSLRWESSSKNFRIDPYTGIVTVHAAAESETYTYTIVTVQHYNLTARARIELAE
jgi:hypothetical protein